ncbi:hypothetical protein O181_077791 [Austropuccinia psidii MF-1]|uniref:Uncharacterized protein n=1 Tax=Austropuccinia psidii MF-1 TaxID=1389203 RepID=A0A9Q3ICF1_9BASI|nr:hypothetical protein [Austropuccinia psidii MF-1]
MGDPPADIPNISNFKLHDKSDAVTKADKQADLINRFVTIAEKIQPKLLVTGENFNTWSRNMLEAWVTVFIGDTTYFDEPSRDSDYRRNLIALAFIQHSVERALFDSITSQLFMPNARNVHQAIKNRFNQASWSSIIQHASIILNPSNHSSDITQHALRLGEAVEAIENQIGTIDSNKIITLSLFFSLPHL